MTQKRPLRTTGAMSMVCWENVRNYHWEFFREMDGCRNDVASHLLVKNPWKTKMLYRNLVIRTCRPDYTAEALGVRQPASGGASP